MAETEREKTLVLLIDNKQREIDSLITDINQPHHLQHSIKTAKEMVAMWQKKLDDAEARAANLDGRLDSCQAQLKGYRAELQYIRAGAKVEKVQRLKSEINDIKKLITPEQWLAFLRENGLIEDADGKLKPAQPVEEVSHVGSVQS